MNNLIPEVSARRARRAYDGRPVPDAVLTRLLEAAVLAPSCSNRQPWRFLVCAEGEPLESARRALSAGNYWARRAPVLIVVLTEDALDCELSDDRKYALFDTGMAAMNLMLQATREGLYAHPMAGFDPFAVRESFSVGGKTRIVTMIAVGYPGSPEYLNEKHRESETSERTRRPLGEVVFRGQWPATG